MTNMLMAIALSTMSTVAIAEQPNAACDIKLGKESYNGTCIVRYNSYEKSWMMFKPSDTPFFADVYYLELKVVGNDTRLVRTMIWDEVVEFGHVNKTSSQCYTGHDMKICYKIK